MDADVNAIQIAMEGRVEYVRATLGLPPREEKPAPRGINDWKEFAAAHNAKRAARRQRKEAEATAKVKARG